LDGVYSIIIPIYNESVVLRELELSLHLVSDLRGFDRITPTVVELLPYARQDRPAARNLPRRLGA
jgi:hypothetical protein